MSKAWRRLDKKYGLIERGRSGRIAVFTSLREDGSAHLRVRRTDGKETPGSMRGRPERIRKVHELRAAGVTIRGIAAELGCSTYTVSRDLEPDHGKAFRRRRRGRHRGAT